MVRGRKMGAISLTVVDVRSRRDGKVDSVLSVVQNVDSGGASTIL